MPYAVPDPEHLQQPENYGAHDSHQSDEAEPPPISRRESSFVGCNVHNQDEDAEHAADLQTMGTGTNESSVVDHAGRPSIAATRGGQVSPRCRPR